MARILDLAFALGWKDSDIMRAMWGRPPTKSDRVVWHRWATGKVSPHPRNLRRLKDAVGLSDLSAQEPA